MVYSRSKKKKVKRRVKKKVAAGAKTQPKEGTPEEQAKKLKDANIETLMGIIT